MSSNNNLLLRQFTCLTAAFRFFVRSEQLKQLFHRNTHPTVVSILQTLENLGKLNADENSSIFLSYQDLLKYRLWPYGAYLVTFRYCRRSENHPDETWTIQKRIVYIVPSMLVKSGSMKISKILWFNICGSISMRNLEILEFEQAPELNVSKIAHVSLIKSPAYPIDLKLENHSEIVDFFDKPRLFYNDDIFFINMDLLSNNEPVYFKLSSQESPCLVNQTTSLYQRSPIAGHLPSQKIFPTQDFLPQPLLTISHQIESLIESRLSNTASPFNPSPVTLVVAGSGIPLLLRHLSDQLCMNLVENDCYDFWSLDGRVPDKAISESIEKAKKYAPCLCVFDGIAILDEDSQARIESGNRTLELLRNSIQTLPPNVIVIFTCQTVELPNLPVTIAEMVHFEYIIENLTEEDRKEFAKFMLKRFKVNEEIGLTWFANNTRGFVLAELNQLVDTAKANASAHGESTIRKQDIQFGIDKRNKAFGDIVGVPKIPSVKWEDVGGMEDVKQIITESLKMNMKRKGLRRSGIVLFGPPGCGKTLIAKAVANEFDITFLSVKGPELLNQYVGQSEQNLRMIFEKARLASPSILFFDELDSLAPNRGVAGDSGGVMDRIVSQLLTELDTLHSKINCEVFVMAATNRPDLLDPCLLTPGRFDKVVYVKPATDFQSKVRILNASCRKLNLANDITVEKIAEKCPEIMSGADLSSLMSKASMYALKQVINRIEQGLEDVKTAQIEITMQHVNMALEEVRLTLNQG